MPCRDESAWNLIGEQLNAGYPYSSLNRVVSIVITEYNLMKGYTEWHQTFRFVNQKNGAIFTDLIEIHTLEPGKLPKKSDGTSLYDWTAFIAAKSQEEMETVAERNPVVRKAAFSLAVLSADEKARMMYENIEKARRDEEAARAFAVREAREQGIADSKREFIGNLLQSDLPMETIAKYVGLSVPEVERIIRETDL